MSVWEEEGSLDVCAGVGRKSFVIEKVVAGLSMGTDGTGVGETEGVIVDLVDVKVVVDGRRVDD